MNSLSINDMVQIISTEKDSGFKTILDLIVQPNIDMSQVMMYLSLSKSYQFDKVSKWVTRDGSKFYSRDEWLDMIREENKLGLPVISYNAEPEKLTVPVPKVGLLKTIFCKLFRD